MSGEPLAWNFKAWSICIQSAFKKCGMEMWSFITKAKASLIITRYLRCCISSCSEWCQNLEWKEVYKNMGNWKRHSCRGQLPVETSNKRDTCRHIKIKKIIPALIYAAKLKRYGEQNVFEFSRKNAIRIVDFQVMYFFLYCMKYKNWIWILIFFLENTILISSCKYLAVYKECFG